MSARELITDYLDLWTGAVTQKRSGGRGNNGKIELTGIKKLRELILELAVRGKLVEQDPDDEPASVLLERIADEKARLVKDGKIRKPRKLPPLTDTNKPFLLPERWEWTQIEAVGHDWGQKEPDQAFSYIDVSAIDNIKGIIKKPETIIPINAPSRARKKVRPNTVIYSTVRPYLQNIAVVEDQIDPEPIASTAFAIVSPLCGTPARYLLHYLRSPVFVRYVESVQTGIAYPAINDKQFFSGALPVPPLKEQHRIVERVDELMALCDRLEQQVGDQLEAHDVLVDTLLDALTRSVDATEVAENWARIAEHFDTLFTTEASIDKLKQTILQLAVMGRLVPQDAEEEPASMLLEKIAEKKAKLFKEREIKKPKKLPPVAGNEEPFNIPNSWSWSRIGYISLSSDYGTSEKSFDSIDGYPVLKMGDIKNGRVVLGGQKRIPFNTEGVEGLLLKSGELLYNRTNSAELVGKTGIYDGPDDKYSFASYLIRIRLDKELMLPSYVNMAMNSPRFRLDEIDPHLKQQCGQANVNGTVMSKMRVPVPPTAEQYRIVKKVDDLMSLCNQIKARLGESGETRTHLAEAVVEQAVS